MIQNIETFNFTKTFLGGESGDKRYLFIDIFFFQKKLLQLAVNGTGKDRIFEC